MNRAFRFVIAAMSCATIMATPTFSSVEAIAVASAPGGACIIDSQAGRFGGTAGLLTGGVCTPALTGGQPSSPPTKTIRCGRPGAGSIGTWNPRCGTTLSCFDIDPKTGKRIQLDAYATFVLSGGTPVLQNVWCPTLTQPMPSAQALRQQALRLLPAVRIGSAWSTRALVNAQTILWADTAANRALPTVTVVGRRVALRISFDHATWSFGDQHTDTTRSPGKTYNTTTDPCNTAQCPQYYGHTYTATGPVTITLNIAWRAQFSLDNTTWTDVDPGALTGPPSIHNLTVVQARSTLVPDP
jgi:hypothetical protein